MKIVTTTSVFPPCYPVEKSIDRLSAIGYNGLDLAIDYCVDSPDFPYMTGEWKQWGLMLSKIAFEHGVSFTHAHASGDAGDRDPVFLRGFSLCGIMKIPYIVVYNKSDLKVQNKNFPPPLEGGVNVVTDSEQTPL